MVIKLKAIYASNDNPISEIAKIFDINQSTLYAWIKSYQENGINGLINKPKGHNPSKLTCEEEAQIKEWILNSTTNEGDFIHWTLYKLKAEIERVFGKQVGKSPLWLRMKKRI